MSGTDQMASDVRMRRFRKRSIEFGISARTQQLDFNPKRMGGGSQVSRRFTITPDDPTEDECDD